MKRIAAAAVCAMAVCAFAVEHSWQKTWCEEIDLADITSVPIGMTLVDDGFFSWPTNGSETVLCNAPHEWSEGGSCGALRVSGVLVHCGSRQIIGAMGSHVYASVAEGAFAITNGMHEAVISSSHRTALRFPLQKEKDGSGTIRYEWRANGKELELLVKCFVNERRQMAVCTLLHVKGDGICGFLGAQPLARPIGDAIQKQKGETTK